MRSTHLLNISECATPDSGIRQFRRRLYFGDPLRSRADCVSRRAAIRHGTQSAVHVRVSRRPGDKVERLLLVRAFALRRLQCSSNAFSRFDAVSRVHRSLTSQSFELRVTRWPIGRACDHQEADAEEHRSRSWSHVSQFPLQATSMAEADMPAFFMSSRSDSEQRLSPSARPFGEITRPSRVLRNTRVV